jgi:hypothetical protein
MFRREDTEVRAERECVGFLLPRPHAVNGLTMREGGDKVLLVWSVLSCPWSYPSHLGTIREAAIRV